MKPSLAIIAIILSVIAIVVSLSQPTYNFLTTLSKTENGKPSFNIPDFSLFYTFTYFILINNGTATAHDVSLNLIFRNPPLSNWETTEFVSEIGDGQSVVFEIPIGYYQLNSTVPNPSFTNVSNYEAIIYINCKELGLTNFYFQHFIT